MLHAILLEQREDYAEDEYARPDFQLTVINREQALRLYDEGKQIYLVRVSPWPILVTAREEIERGSDTFQIAIADLEQERNMTERENVLLYGNEKQFGIYQITERDPEHNYRFMGLDYVQKKGMTVARADYDLIYTAPLTEKDTLDGIYERFNIQRPADFTGHSLSVSDVVVLNDGSTVKAYYVDSIGFAELPDFFKERNLDLQKENLLNEELQEINQYRVFQIKEVHHQHWAKSYAQQVEDGFLIHHQNYQSAYKGKPAPSDTPMTARKRLEEKRPNTFIGRSFGVGDVIVWDEEKGRKFFYVDKEELVEFGGFMDADAAGNTVIYMVPNYQIDGKTGTWLPYDSEVVEGVCFFMMRNEQRKDAVSPVVVDSKGVFVTDAPNGFENVRSTLTEYVQRAEKKQQDMTEHEKCLTNGTYERARESGTEQNYDMIDGCVNNVPKKPRRIGGRWSVLDRLHIKQAQRKQKDQTQQQQQERSRKN